MKKIVVSFGKGLIDITAWLWVFIIILSTVVTAINTSTNENAYIILPIVWIVALIALIVFVQKNIHSKNCIQTYKVVDNAAEDYTKYFGGDE